jgi:16S rRNA processing protein RimM
MESNEHTPAQAHPGSASDAQPAREPRRKKSFNPVTTAREPREGYTAVGRVLRPHGLAGELRVSAFSPTARNLQRGRPVFLAGVRRVIMRARLDREAWILKLEGLSGRDEVETLRGELLEVPDREVVRDDDESYFVHEIVGLRVVTASGRELGTVRDVIQTGANDVYVVDGPAGEVLVPAISDVIEAIDISGGVMRITPLAGMLDETE